MRIVLVLAWLGALALPAAAEAVRIALYTADLTRSGPGLLLNDLGRDDPQIDAVVAIVQAVRPDVLVLLKIDHDLDGRALAALADRLETGDGAIAYPHRFTAPVNAGVPSGLDLTGDGRVMGPDDAHGHGAFPGAGGMAVLSRLPFDHGAVRTFRTLPWAAVPGARLPDGLGPEAAAGLRLAARSLWDLPVRTPAGSLHLWIGYATPPLYGPPGAFNRRRNAAEIGFFRAYLNGHAFLDDQGLRAPRAAAPAVIVANLNADPHDGDGDRGAIAALLGDPRLNDPEPGSPGAAALALPSRGPPGLRTAYWPRGRGALSLRVGYILPEAGLQVLGQGVFWPAPDDPLAETVARASSHRLIWVDIALP